MDRAAGVAREAPPNIKGSAPFRFCAGELSSGSLSAGMLNYSWNFSLRITWAATRADTIRNGSSSWKVLCWSQPKPKFMLGPSSSGSHRKG